MMRLKKMAVVAACILASTAAARAENVGPWDLDALGRVPKAEWGAVSNGVQEVYYEGEPFSGRPMVCYLRLIDERGLAVTTPHVEWP